MQQCPCGDHFGVQARVPAQQPVEDTTIAVGPVHHGGDAEAPGADMTPEPGPACVHVWAHGLMTVTPAASNGLVSRVATEKPFAAAIAAM